MSFKSSLSCLILAMTTCLCMLLLIFLHVTSLVLTPPQLHHLITSSFDQSFWTCPKKHCHIPSETHAIHCKPCHPSAFSSTSSCQTSMFVTCQPWGSHAWRITTRGTRGGKVRTITLQHGWLHSNVDNCSCYEFPILLTIGQTEYTTMGEPFLLSSAYLTPFLEATRFLWLSHVIIVHKAQPSNKLRTIFAMVIQTTYSNSLSTISVSSSKVSLLQSHIHIYWKLHDGY